MSIVNKWGTDPVQKNFFKRQVEFRRTLDQIIMSGGSQVIADNTLEFKLSTSVRTLEDMTDLVLNRCFKPVLKEGGYILPQIFGVNTQTQVCTVYLYAPILKEFNGKVAGLVDVLTGLLGRAGCHYFGFVTGSREGKMGSLAVVSAHEINEKTVVRRAFTCNNGEIEERNIPIGL